MKIIGINGLEISAITLVLEQGEEFAANVASRYELYDFSAHSGQIPWLTLVFSNASKSLQRIEFPYAKRRQ